MAQLGKAYIEVRADLSKFPTELRAQLQKAFKEGTAGITFEELDHKAAQEGEKVADEIGSGMERKSKTRSKKAGEAVAKDVGLGFFATVRKLFSGGSGGRTSGGTFFSGITDLFKGASNSASAVTDQLSSVGDKIKDIGGKIGGTFSAIGQGATTLFYVLLVPAVIAGISALIQLSGALLALPAAFALVGATIAPLIIAFHGVGDAIGAGFSGNVDKFNQALKGLAPSARAVVKEIVGLKSSFEAIKSATQQAFFAPLVGSFKALQTTLLPALRTGLATAAAALGRFVAGFLQLLSKPDVLATITQTFSTLAQIIDRMGPAATAVFEALFGLVKAGLPFVQQFSNYLATASEKFAAFLTSAEGSGKIAKLIEGAAKPFGELVKLLAVVGDLLLTVFTNPDVEKGSNTFIEDLTKAIGLLDEFFHSAEGKKVLKDLGDALEHAGLVMIGLAGIIIGVLEALHYMNAGLKIAVVAVGAFFQAVGRGAVIAVVAIGHFFAYLGGIVADFFTKTIPQAFNAVVGFFSSIGSAIGDFFTKTIPGWFDAVVGFFDSLPNRAGKGLADLQTTILNFIRNALEGLVDSVARNIGRAIGLILAAPFLIKTGLEKLGGIISDAFTSALHGVEGFISDNLTAIGQLFTVYLPGLISSGLTAVENFLIETFNTIVQSFVVLGTGIANAAVSVYHAIVDGISQGVTDAKNFVVDGFNAVVGFFNDLPGRIASLGPALLRAAKDLGRQIGNGLKDIGNFASDIGHDIVNTIRSGVNHIIDSVNSGIADIDNAIPISLPRLPHLERGGIIDSPTVALLGEKNKREVVVPLTDPGRAQQLAQQSGLTQILAKGAATPVINITAILDGFGVMGIVKQTVTSSLDSQGSELAFGVR